MENIRFVGTSHISQQSKERVKQAFLDFKPDIVAVELDKNRLKGLIEGQSRLKLRMIKHIGLTGFIFAAIGRYIQKKLGKVTGMTPGEDMMSAVKIAGKNDKRVALIDQDMTITMRRLSKTVSFKEKAKMVWDLLTSPLRNTFKIEIDITKVPEDELVEKLTSILKERYPQMHNVLIEERNTFMADAIRKIREENPDKKILVVIGAGHKKGMKKLLQDYLNQDK